MSLDITKASLHQLGELGGDRIIIGEIDDKLIHLPNYLELHDRWERQHWSIHELDFKIDRQQWVEIPIESHPFWISDFALFFQGEASVTKTLIPYCAAVPMEDQRVFLITQLADEVQHTSFFDRFFREVLMMDGPDTESLLLQIKPLLAPAPCEILIDGLEEIGLRIHNSPQKIEYLIEGVTLYHIIVEGTLALAGQRSILNRNRRMALFPGFQQGFTAIARDESRHVLFGVRFLRDMVQGHQEYAKVIHNTVMRWMPQIHSTLSLTKMQRALLTTFGEDPDEMKNFALNSLQKKLKAIGLKWTIPSVEPMC